MFESKRAFSGFSVDDLQEAKKFYGRTLELDVSEHPQGLELRLSNDKRVFIYPKTNHKPATFTVLNFPVDDIGETIDELQRRGVRLEHYDESSIKTDEKGVFHGPGANIAWFKDPAGNILSVLEEST